MVIFQISVPHLHIQTQLYEGRNWLQAKKKPFYPGFQRQCMVYNEVYCVVPSPATEQTIKLKLKKKNPVVNNVPHWLSIWLVGKERETERETSHFKQKICIYYWLVNPLTSQYKILTDWHFGQPSKIYKALTKFCLYYTLVPEASELSLYLY